MRNSYGLPAVTVQTVCTGISYVYKQHVVAPVQRFYKPYRDTDRPAQPVERRAVYASPPQLSYTPGNRTLIFRQGSVTRVNERPFDAPRMKRW